jgi:hypothetical protein
MIYNRVIYVPFLLAALFTFDSGARLWRTPQADGISQTVPGVLANRLSGHSVLGLFMSRSHTLISFIILDVLVVFFIDHL